MNKQPIMKQNIRPTGILSVHSIFPTIQGEGPYAGNPAHFIRLAGCNLRCPLCDTDYTNNLLGDMSPAAVVSYLGQFDKHAIKLVVITGGEPFRQNITPLVNLLLSIGFKVQIETNGSLYLPDLPYNDITVVCSPKTGSINATLAKHIKAFKYVLHADQIEEADGLPTKALDHSVRKRVARPPNYFAGYLYVQPVDVGDEAENHRHMQAAINSCLKFGYTLCVQIHKIIGVE